MKIGSLVAGALPLLMLVACGGGEPKKSAVNEVSKSTKTAAQQDDAKVAAASGKGAQQGPTKRIRRPRVDFRMVKALLGNETPAPKAPVESTPALVALGRTLYNSEHLSAEGNLSCASCHVLKDYGVDNKQFSPGSTGKLGERNTPSTYNAHRQFRQFWDGRAASVEEQAIMPVLNPIEHGLADEAAVIAKIMEKAELVDGFKKAFPGEESPVTAKNFGIAIGAFERTLVTRSKWDDYLDGNQKAFSNEELLGLKTFMDVGCTQCHLNRALGGHAYQKLGLLKPYKGKDTGRMQVTGNVSDKYMFKVPTLLNVEKTSPYYHDGSVATLEEAVTAMAENQLNKKLKPEQVASIVTFLKTLTGPLAEK